MSIEIEPTNFRHFYIKVLKTMIQRSYNFIFVKTKHFMNIQLQINPLVLVILLNFVNIGNSNANKNILINFFDYSE